MGGSLREVVVTTPGRLCPANLPEPPLWTPGGGWEGANSLGSRDWCCWLSSWGGPLDILMVHLMFLLMALPCQCWSWC